MHSAPCIHAICKCGKATVVGASESGGCGPGSILLLQRQFRCAALLNQLYAQCTHTLTADVTFYTPSRVAVKGSRAGGGDGGGCGDGGGYSGEVLVCIHQLLFYNGQVLVFG